MPKRIQLDAAYIERIKKERSPIVEQVIGMEAKKVPCHFCQFRTIDKYQDLVGHFSAFCPRCGQIGIYNAADYRHYTGAFIPNYNLGNSIRFTTK